MFAWTLPAVAAATASQEQVTGQGATSTQAMNAPAPAFPPGCQVTVLDEIVVRAKESLDSEVITVLREATREEKPSQDRSLRKYMRTRAPCLMFCAVAWSLRHAGCTSDTTSPNVSAGSAASHGLGIRG